MRSLATGAVMGIALRAAHVQVSYAYVTGLNLRCVYTSYEERPPLLRLPVVLPLPRQSSCHSPLVTVILSIAPPSHLGRRCPLPFGSAPRPHHLSRRRK